MWKYALALIVLLFFINTYLHNFLAEPSADFHRLCLNRLQSSGRFAPDYQMIVCGANFKHGFSTIESYLQARFLVVSALQVLALEFVLSFYFRRRSLFGSIIIPFMLVLYALATGLRGIIVRACLQLIVDQTIIEEKWGWPPITSCSAAGLVGLAVFPQFAVSGSYIISWVASSWTRGLRKIRYRGLLLFFLMYPVFFGIPDLLTPVYILLWLIRPAMLAVLILPSFFVFAFPNLHFLVDPVWHVFFWLAQNSDKFLPYPLDSSPARPAGTFFLWTELIAATVFGLLILRQRRRKIFRHTEASSQCAH